MEIDHVFPTPADSNSWDKNYPLPQTGTLIIEGKKIPVSTFTQCQILHNEDGEEELIRLSRLDGNVENYGPNVQILHDYQAPCPEPSDQYKPIERNFDDLQPLKIHPSILPLKQDFYQPLVTTTGHNHIDTSIFSNSLNVKAASGTYRIILGQLLKDHGLASINICINSLKLVLAIEGLRALIMRLEDKKIFILSDQFGKGRVNSYLLSDITGLDYEKI
ncbi:MAG: hypothetical protein Q7R49_06300 [Candidatus Daviesbacteria bacterium]|nr:hypothetical protein [Candidatus Daviesbacteria bacterium]